MEKKKKVELKVSKSKKKLKKERGPTKKGWRSRERSNVGTFNCRGMKNPLKMMECCREFAARNYMLIMGISEYWGSGKGALRGAGT